MADHIVFDIVSDLSAVTGTKFLKVMCDEHGIGGDGEYCGDNDAQLGRIIVFNHGA
jgi:hypothetical protein